MIFDIPSDGEKSDVITSHPRFEAEPHTSFVDDDEADTWLRGRYAAWVRTKDPSQTDALFLDLYHQYERYIKTIIRSHGGDLSADDVDDLCQDVLRSLFEVRHYEATHELRSFICGIARKIVVQFLRSQLAQKRDFRREDPCGDACLSSLTAPEGSCLWQDIYEALGDRFTRRAWELFERHYREGCSFDELAEEEGCNEKTVRRLCVRFRNAVAALSKKEKSGFTFSL